MTREPVESLDRLVAAALREDLGDSGPAGDVTTWAIVASDAVASARIVARSAGVVAGIEPAQLAFTQVDPATRVRWLATDGDAVSAGGAIAEVEGPLRALLTAERTALNFLGHLSGVATLTRRFAKAAGQGVTILDTRKTLPGLRLLQKAAVVAGGGANHRMGLHDAVLVKDNHLAYAAVREAVKLARDRAPGLLVEVECETIEQVEEAVEARADRVLLDNMSPDQVREAVTAVDGRLEVEVSGGITLDNVTAYAAAGPDFISVGALTHSAPSLDVSLEVLA
ncbi:MAG TPA: carboxylating nicotinate-nucleotide diphosphorylase [Acidimicrobiia bacterium]|nr:carboxylating nicotinate-nucleotide diphosphorylase [Acidimicrobiia bacterium]